MEPGRKICYNRTLHIAIPEPWGYTSENGPSKWAQLSDAYALCEKGKRQSPIAIETVSTIHNNKTSIKFDRLDVLMNGTLMNTGHGVEYKPTFGTPVPLAEVNVDFPGLEMCHRFRLAQFHFHWGQINEEGSEHVVDGRRGCGEVHFVFINNKYGRSRFAINQSDGVLVLGYLLSVERKSVFDEIFKSIPLIKVSNDKVKDVSLQASEFFQDKQNAREFFVYQGSLTTPPCHENVTWFLSSLPLGISQEQLSLLRSQRVDEHTQLRHNFRPLQPLNGRSILRISCKYATTYNTIVSR